MQTECSVEQLEFQGVGCRTVVGRLDAGRTDYDGGLLRRRLTLARGGRGLSEPARASASLMLS
jgi:hypothetical protein